jgi:hypothetical protein
MTTEFIDMCHILAQFDESVWKYHQDYEEFTRNNDIGLPLAYLNTNGLAIPTKQGVEFVEKTWADFLATVGVDDNGYKNLSDVIVRG